MRRQKCPKHIDPDKENVCKPAVHTAFTRKHAWNHGALILRNARQGRLNRVECRCGKLLLWSNYHLHNQDSSLWAWCRYIYLLWQQTLQAYRHAGRIENGKKHFTVNMFTVRPYACMPVCFECAPWVPPKHENKQTINSSTPVLRQMKTLLLWFSMRSWACTDHHNTKTSAHKHIVQHDFWSRQTHHSSSLVIFVSPAFPGPGVYGLTMGWQRSVVTSLTD